MSRTKGRRRLPALFTGVAVACGGFALVIAGPATPNSPPCNNGPGPQDHGEQVDWGSGCFNRNQRWEEKCNPTGNIRARPWASSTLHGTYAYGAGILKYNSVNFQYVQPQCNRPGTDVWHLTPQGWVSQTTVIQTN